MNANVQLLEKELYGVTDLFDRSDNSNRSVELSCWFRLAVIAVRALIHIAQYTGRSYLP